ncbi:DNA binding methylated-DNA--cysteine S-methyltransferase [Microthyrium microscopicum]|uniref:DNA binding methylated-DNA--cysteine S-methyltransferase n=1 Tax=Microthyrium microscopicum TaxID=703497 RepID=A0A6A6TWP9_9PEZI|nr:DNA binding methylated-DNA--cysteine S-methyltransferase [Microthyrium microscopicum]
MEKDRFYASVYEAIQEVPYGKVTTYGHIARLIGRPEYPRGVGTALKNLPSDANLRFNESSVPWQRVVNAKGSISPRGPGSQRRQADALGQEGVEVSQDAMGEYSVNFGEYGWFPELLPSEEAEMAQEQES